MRERYYSTSAKKDTVIYQLTDATNLLSAANPSIHFFADIDDVDIRSLYMSMERKYGQSAGGKSVSEIMRMFSALSLITDYLMSDRRDESMRSPRPHDNLFKRYKFHNFKDYKMRTPIIPESVAEGIDAHLCELDKTQALLYRIFSNTGMRMNEVLFLEVDCLEPSPYDGLVQLKYKPYKTLDARRKQGAPDYHRVLIFQSLADEIIVQIQERAKVREELAYWLGHLGRNSASGYYAEVRQMKLAALNTDFYYKKFDLRLSGEQLAEYSEEERRLLYMDFRLEQRRVEFGFCLKKLGDDGCSNKNSLFNCVNCKNLCTGKAYLPYWIELLETQTHLVDNLLATYSKEGILDYED